MWNVDPTKMCRQHLLGEHLEMHMFVGALRNGKNLYGYIENGLVCLCEVVSRHNLLAQEMVNRGYNHKSPLVMPKILPSSITIDDWTANLINVVENQIVLHNRCKNCKF